MGEIVRDISVLGRRLQQRRFDLRKRQKVVAEEVGVTPQFLSNLERGILGKVHPSVIARLADVLETTADYLLGRSDAPDRPSRPARKAVANA